MAFLTKFWMYILTREFIQNHNEIVHKLNNSKNIQIH